MNNKLWLTYAWKDNENANVDHVVHSLQAAGLDVRYDRIQLLAGRRLWDQIDKAITNPSQCDGWAIFVTKNSLTSEGCQEEIAYALDRALKSRGEFPLIGIIPEPIDRSLLHSAIATRLFVTLQDPEWTTRVKDAVAGTPSVKGAEPPSPYLLNWHPHLILEVRPRSGRWYPFDTLVPSAERDRLKAVYHGPYGKPPTACAVHMADKDITINQGAFSGIRIFHAITNLDSAYIQFSESPTTVLFGTEPNFNVIKRRS